LYRLTATPAVDHMGHNPNTGLTGNSKGRRGVKTPSGSRKKAKESPPDSSLISSITPTDITLELRSGRKRTRETTSVSGEAFLSGMHDFRAFGRTTWTDLVELGVVEVLQQNLAGYWKCRTYQAKARLLVPAEELPLSTAAQMHLHERVLAVQALFKDLHSR
jgi:hypothetical protein